MGAYDYGLDELKEWETASYGALLLDSPYTFDRTHRYVVDLTNEMTVSGYVRADITTPASVVDTVDHLHRYACDALDFGIPDPGGNYQYAVVYKFVTNDTNSVLCTFHNLGSTYATAGRPLVIPVPRGIATVAAS